ncbi:MAG: primosomal protein N' [Mogibacterium sp.]|nr:primosomal protein N' [Mogibacterium sp.]
MQYVEVVIDNKSEYTDNLYTYLAPDTVTVGAKVTVPFGTRRKPVDGYVFAVQVSSDLPESRVKSVLEVDERRSLSPEMIGTARWMRKRYGVKYIDAVKLFTVGGKRERGMREVRPQEEPEQQYALTEEQNAAVRKVRASLESGRHKAYLLKGVTNSGKTEVFLHAAAAALESGRTVIMLVPEIALAAQTEIRFRKRFGAEKVAILHSKLTTSERLKEWLRIRSGEARIVIGARTAVFAPVENLGLIVIDEEHESTYKSDHNPKYETVDVAYRRTQAHGAVLLLGSATPSVVSFYRAGTGVYELLEMKHRVGNSMLPRIEIVDMRESERRGHTGILSERLLDEMRLTLERGEQVILFLNRRGYSTQILCPDCGYRYSCEECGIALTYHKREHAAVCHYCGRKYPLLTECPSCGSKYLKYVGTGTEKVEETIALAFPEHKAARFDLDTAKSQREIDQTIRAFHNRKTDILVGTQILAKGLDFRNVGLVGIILADVTLNIPDYRSPERTFQLITQVAGRAGRNTSESRVIIQTYVPEDEAIQSAAAHDYERFYEGELLHRNIMNYPPYSDIIAVSCTEKEDRREEDADPMETAEAFRRKLLALKDAPADAVLYPPREDTRFAGQADRRRATFLIKAPKGTRGGYIQAYMEYRDMLIRTKSGCYIEIDVNPYGII